MKNANTIITPSPFQHNDWPIIIAGLIAGLAWAALAFNSRHYGDATLAHLLSVCFIAAAASLAVHWHYKHNKIEPNLTLILIFAFAYRVIGLFTFPVLEDDFYRFLWDGFITSNLGSPYEVAPSSFFGQAISEQFEAILDAINYPDSNTIYGPSAQWLFFLAHQLAPGEIWPLKLIMVTADGLIIALLARTTNKSAFMLYAWSPLVIKEFVISLHPDIIGVLFIVLAIKAYQAKKDFSLGAFLALALGVKLFAIIIAPFLLLHRWRAWLGLFLTATLIAWPFGIQQAWLPSGLNTMNSSWLFNAPIYELLLPLMAMPTLKMSLLGLFLVAGLSYGIRWWLRALKDENDSRPMPRGDYLFLLFFLCIPVFNPWYAIWLIPFALKWPSAWVMIGSVSLLLSYASGINLNTTENGLALANYQHPNWVLIIEFGTIAIALFISIGLTLHKRFQIRKKY